MMFLEGTRIILEDAASERERERERKNYS